MGIKERYASNKEELLKDKNICVENRATLRKYFDWHENKLKRINNLIELDDACCKTLYQYVCMFRNVNRWFRNKPFTDITKKDVERVYNCLEDGLILNANGKPHQDRMSYYTKIFKSKFFKMLGKYEYADEVMEFCKPTTNHGKVAFFSREEFEKLATVAAKPQHKLLLWLAWDIGENVAQTLLRLQKKDIRRRLNPDTQEPEYLINLPQEKIKRSRTPRSEPTNFPETTRLLDMILDAGKRVFIEDVGGKEFRRIYDEQGVRRLVKGRWIVRAFEDNDLIFDFEQKQAEKILRQCVDKTGVRCEPDGEKPTLKDLRSSMACYLLKEGWSIDEVKARMGHKPSSSVINKYATYLAMDKHKPKKKLFDGTLAKLQKETEDAKQREKLYTLRVDNQKTEIEAMKKRMDELNVEQRIRQEVDIIMNQLVKDPHVRKLLSQQVKRTTCLS